MSAEPCSTCQTAAWYRWYDTLILRGMERSGLGFQFEDRLQEKPRICDDCRERLGRIAAQYRPKESAL